MSKKILIIDAHPDKSSLCCSLADSYLEKSSAAGFDVQKLSLRDLEFDLNLKHGYRIIQELEPDLIKSQKLIKWCEHLVIIYPMWWGMVPALLKGFLDRCWLPGFAFKYHENDPFWDRLLSGRSARIIVTSDAPYFYNLFAYLNAPYRIMKKTILGFCGFKPVKLTAIGNVKNMKEDKIKKVINEIGHLGLLGK
ncbi:MAG: NAD(P)H-dependent oxidoreductase [Bdellovibrionales bacterium]|nr:NAD(P)H-dependent oxidoreductase [Bdellovibrionales bacterium]